MPNDHGGGRHLAFYIGIKRRTVKPVAHAVGVVLYRKTFAEKCVAAFRRECFKLAAGGYSDSWDALYFGISDVAIRWPTNVRAGSCAVAICVPAISL